MYKIHINSSPTKTPIKSTFFTPKLYYSLFLEPTSLGINMIYCIAMAIISKISFIPLRLECTFGNFNARLKTQRERKTEKRFLAASGCKFANRREWAFKAIKHMHSYERIPISLRYTYPTTAYYISAHVFIQTYVHVSISR